MGWAGPAGAAEPLSAMIERDLAFARRQLARTVAEVADVGRYPRATGPDGRWRTVGPEDWTSGFFPGCLWLMFEATGADRWRAWARAWTEGLAGQGANAGTHDLGFMIFTSFGAGHRLTGDPAYRDVVLGAARALASRYSPKVGAIRAWDWGPWRYPVIVDTMMNLELLFWAARNGGGAGWRALAAAHARTTLAAHMRADGGLYHLVDYDPESGAIRAKGTYQGRADGSVWARGQAWGLYGFALAYRETREARFLAAARRAADHYLARLPPDHVPYWDFDAAGTPGAERDSSAAAIAASGLLALASLAGEHGRGYREAAARTLRTLSSRRYLAPGAGSRGLLLHGVGHRPANREVDVSLIYGDYYFLEALLRLRRGP